MTVRQQILTAAAHRINDEIKAKNAVLDVLKRNNPRREDAIMITTGEISGLRQAIVLLSEFLK